MRRDPARTGAVAQGVVAAATAINAPILALLGGSLCLTADGFEQLFWMKRLANMAGSIQ